MYGEISSDDVLHHFIAHRDGLHHQVIRLVCSRSKEKILASTIDGRLLSRAVPPVHYHTCCDVAQSTRSVARGSI
ncbi:hypothetical protein Y032_0003g1557 [Ancylostoma ceylanicum]|uniref:Uncharacterized protein n=1 Tax=Ancylostoma ceylanicum TaxID=53326 RepID=A0A016VXT0_9BILA|nr:hypothetical protein Y032_0003g1557 [Ancylostoma ceylanicum]